MPKLPNKEKSQRFLYEEEFAVRQKLFERIEHWYVAVGLSQEEAWENVKKEVGIQITLARFRKLLKFFKAI